jgi:predicted TIM-barrel fold metal-dependent hydrolase
MIIDGHCHAGLGDGLSGPWDTNAGLDRYLVRAARAGITRTVVFAAFNSDYRVANRAVARLVRSHRKRLLGFAFVHPQRDAGRIGSMVEEAVVRYGFRGIKVHGSEAPVTREVCEAARRFGLPILYDIVGRVERVELLAREYPDVSFIIPHLGSFAEEWRVQLALIDHLVRHPNVYADTSGVRNFDLLMDAVRRAGSRKLIFGSDGPWIHPAVELAKVRELRLPPRDEQRVLSDNLLGLLSNSRRHRGWGPRATTGGDGFSRGALAKAVLECTFAGATASISRYGGEATADDDGLVARVEHGYV